MKRFLLLISRHPVLARDEVVKFFLSASGHVSHQQIPLQLLPRQYNIVAHVFLL